MIRVRNSRGQEIVTVEPIATVEICSTDGKVARLILVAGPRILILTPQDPELRNYCRLAGLEVAEEIHVSNH
jgi:hypothetical protein